MRAILRVGTSIKDNLIRVGSGKMLLQNFLYLVDVKDALPGTFSKSNSPPNHCEQSELLIDAASAKILPASDSEHRPRRGGVRLLTDILPASDSKLRHACFKKTPPRFLLSG